jgi:DNA-directed RNA polymerase subunit RPC12/RpoP
MKCLVCHSDNAEWVETIMENEDEGYEAYACKDCRSRTEYGIRVKVRFYTGHNNIFTFEEE